MSDNRIMLGWVEVSADRYRRMLDIVSPAVMEEHGFLVGEPIDHRTCSISDEEGVPTYAAFFERQGHYLESTYPMTVAEFDAAYAAAVAS